MTQRDRIMLSVLAVAGILAGLWFGVLKGKREEVAALEEQVVQQQTARDAALTQVAASREAKARFAEDYATVVRLGKAVPAGDQVPSLIFGLETTARRHEVDVRSIKLRAGGGTGAGSAAEAAAAVKPVDAQQADVALAPPGSVVGAAGLPTLPFSFKFDGDFFDMERFLAELERNTTTRRDGVVARGRLVTVDGFSIGPSKLGGFPKVEASVSATTYVLPPGEGATAGATPSGPAVVPAGTTTAAAPASPSGGASGAGAAPATVGGIAK